MTDEQKDCKKYGCQAAQITALEAKAATLRAALEAAANDLLSAADDVESWGAYASEYFQRRHNLPREIAHIQECAECARKALEATK